MTSPNCIGKEVLTPAEIDLIQTTWSLVGDSVEMAIDFYNRLFYLYPHLRPMFKEDIRLQARKFTAHLSYLIRNTYDWKRIAKDVEDLGGRHMAYAVKEEHYNYVKEALLYALERHLNTAWNEETVAAWNKFYRMTAELMMNSFHKK